MRTDDEQQVFQQIAGSFDEPAFLRRARATENAWVSLLERARKQQVEWLKIPRLRLGRLAMLAPNFQACEPIITADTAAELRSLHSGWNPQLKRAVARATKQSQIQTAIDQLIAAFERFNTRWSGYVAELNYDYVNNMRQQYNRWYVIEKECALQSFRTATTGFKPLPMVTVDDVTALLPLLPVLN